MIRCVLPPETTARNREMSAGRGLPWLADTPEHGRPLAIVGGGHSAREHLGRILAWPGDIMAINGAYGWLCAHGRVPELAIGVDPQPVLADIYSDPRSGTRWYIASICDPALFDRLAGHDVTVFDVPQYEGDSEKAPQDVPGGSSAMTRAPVLGAVLGHREMTIFGADCCYRFATSHAWGGEIPADAYHIAGAGRMWVTDNRLRAQAESLTTLICIMAPKIRITLVGDHLASAMLKFRQDAA